MEGKQLEGREKNFKQMFEGRRRNAEGLENSRENGVGRGNFEYIYIRRKRDKEEVDKISFTYERFSKFLSENQIPEKFRWFHSEGVVYVENRKGLINIPPYNKLKDFK